ncbi:ABC transporter permease [Streptomyces pseudovenezuelae]|uniref:ABC transport system permease protein n=1 Tax=Streptomyces pseudovenezuelae TaxID=67350 RepID=A0ABT6M3T0_9ACTN|nr:ABC transporter permease [Streptomyces pseudovenezuelae]MDH6222299.1 putative ABC transport system permease protein [Streptomyces pseudovenezuelae]
MLTVAVQTLRTRWVTFAGSFVALALGVALIAVMGQALAASLDAPERRPERFAAAEVVVQGQDTLRVPTSNGVRTEKLAQPRPVPARTIAALRHLGKVSEDRSFAVRTEGGPHDLVGHPWSTAAYAPYELTAGRAPRAADEVVTTGDWTEVGRHLRTDFGPVHVVGTLDGLPFENALFYTDSRAARLSPVSTQLVVDADAAAVRRGVNGVGEAGAGVRVLTGDARKLADADPDRDAEALTALNALFGTAGGVTGFVSVFVVASTFAFSVAQRRREFGLLRLAGATPAQLRRTVCAEALFVGVAASATGCALGAYAAPQLASRVVDGGLAPAWFAIGDHTWPYHLAFWTGLLVSLCGVLAASRRAGRTSPADALREASVDTAALTGGRLLSGTALLITAVATQAFALLTDPGDLLHRKTYVSRPMLLITAVALLSPAVVRPLVRLVVRLPGAVGMLVRENAAAGVRRTAAVAAPVLVTVALTGSLLGATATLEGARATEARGRTVADFVLTSTAGTGFSPATLRRLRAVPDAIVSPTATTAVYVLEDGVALIKSQARAADPHALATTVRLPLTAGRVTDLDDDSIVVNEEWARHTVGRHVTVWLGDGTRKSLRVAAVMPVGTGDNGAYVTPANAPRAPVDRVDVKVREDATTGAVAVALRKAVSGTGAEVLTRADWLRRTAPSTSGGLSAGTDRTTRLGFLLVLGIALLYTGISLANTLVMATSDRLRDLETLRLTGATRSQLLRLITAESLTTVALGAFLGLLVAALNLLGMWTALARQSVWTPLRLPWPALALTTTACAALAVTAALIPTAFALRRRAAGTSTTT